MKSFLEGGTPSRETEWFRDDELFGFDARTGIGVDADCLTAAKSQIVRGAFPVSAAERSEKRHLAGIRGASL